MTVDSPRCLSGSEGNPGGLVRDLWDGLALLGPAVDGASRSTRAKCRKEDHVAAVTGDDRRGD